MGRTRKNTETVTTHHMVRCLFNKVQQDKISVNELARRSKLHINTLYSWFNDESAPRVDLLETALNAVGLTLAATPLVITTTVDARVPLPDGRTVTVEPKKPASGGHESWPLYKKLGR